MITLGDLISRLYEKHNGVTYLSEYRFERYKKYGIVPTVLHKITDWKTYKARLLKLSKQETIRAHNARILASISKKGPNLNGSWTTYLN